MIKQYMLFTILLLVAGSDCLVIQNSNNQLVRLRLFEVRPQHPNDVRSPLATKLYQQVFSSSSVQHLNGEVNIERLNSVDESRYCSQILIGDPPQKFNVLLDTGSVDLWIPSVKCKSKACESRNRYDSSQSNTSKQLRNNYYELSYLGNASLSGRLLSDRVTLAGIQVDDQVFAEAHHLRGRLIEANHFDGVLGLGTRPLFPRQVPNLIQNMMDRHLIGEPLLSWHIHTRKGGGVNIGTNVSTIDAGEIILGGLDRRLFVGEPTFVPVSGISLWFIRMDKVGVVKVANGNQSGQQQTWTELVSECEMGCRAAIDTGAVMLAGPPKAVDSINRRLGAKHIGDGVYQFDNKNCTTVDPTLKVSFRIGGKQLLVGSDGYTFLMGTRCMSELKPVQGDEFDWLLGNRFMENYHTIFDFGRKRVGFAVKRF